MAKRGVEVVDQMVLKAQQWVNATYRSVPGYNVCAEDGSTGWSTIYSLLRALQHELGIVSLSDNFGTTTWSLLSAYGKVGISSSNMNMRIIAEAAMYCKGYSGGVIDGAFDLPTQNGLFSLTSDMGLDPQNVVTDVTPKVFRGLLTMDAYVQTSGGGPAIRTCQQWLNRAYLDRGQYFIGPCDGHFSRAMQGALVLSIQYQLGLTDSQVTGSIGPTTRTGLQTAAFVSTTSGTAAWIRLFQTAVAGNGYANSWGDSGGSYTASLASTVRAFQEFCKLPQSGAGDYQTWMSLLVSTGDPSRNGTACDCALPLNSTSIVTAKNLGYRIVGRYITGGTNKILTSSEIALIFDNGMSFFPIYQEYGDSAMYFSYDQGLTAGQEAFATAARLGIPDGTVVYFSVDFDALDSEITSYVIPHFRGVADAAAAAARQYAVGVYGCRNTCTRVSLAGLATRSFVSGMSTGYSGNLGFPLPDNWAFDQIRNFTSNGLELDNDIASDRDPGVNSVTRPRDPNDGFYTYLIWLEARALQWRQQGNITYSQAELVGQWLRLLNSVNNKVYLKVIHISDQIFGSYDAGFIDFVQGYAGRPDELPLRDPALLWDSDNAHFGASFGAIQFSGFPSVPTLAGQPDFGTWGGDLLSILGQVHQEGISAGDAYAFAAARIGTTADDSFYNRSDYIADVDAIVIGRACRADPSLLLSDLFKSYYSGTATARARFQAFLNIRFGGDAATLRSCAESMFDTMAGGTVTTIRDSFWYDQFGGITCPSPSFVSGDIRTAVAQAYVDTAIHFATA